MSKYVISSTLSISFLAFVSLCYKKKNGLKFGAAELIIGLSIIIWFNFDKVMVSLSNQLFIIFHLAI